ncbi:MAG TPA: hypothetical protein VMW41_00465 [Candidatus Bathyarchaeia archaeon]|nr:hypothetical protein [Candidatus Bathyarchaeia archaeon]
MKMKLPKVVLGIVKIIHEKSEISPKKDKIIIISLWDFRDEKKDTIPKDDLRKVLRLLEEERLLRLTFTEHLNRPGRKAVDKVEFEINRELFSKFYKEHRKDLIPLHSTEDTHKNEKATITPFCETKKNWGYLKFDKFSERIKIGGKDTRHFRLLQCLLEPLGVTKTIEAVFEAIRKPQDKDDSLLSSWDTKKTRKVNFIEYAIKELQKGNKLKGKIRFQFFDNKTKIKAELLD